MPEIVEIPLSDLLVDVRNARLKQEQPTQQAALLALAKQQGRRILKLATDIVEYGLDPTTLPAVVPTDDQRKRYLVIEGNRRIVALKTLETPSLVAAVLDTKDQKVLQALAARFARQPLSTVTCVLFDSEAEVEHWVTLRHTGQNEGVGLVEWGADEKDRYAARHGRRSAAGQVLDFVERYGALSQAAADSNKGVITNLSRMINDRKVRETIGVDLDDGEVYSRFPVDEVVKGLTYLVEDLKTGNIKVGDIYYKEDRQSYLQAIPKKYLPNSSSRLPAPLPLASLEAGSSAPRVRRARKRAKSRVVDRTSLIPKSCDLDISPPRVNAIFIELLTLSVDQYPNACSILLRVFVELSVDNVVETRKLMTEAERRNTPLAKRIKVVVADLERRKRLTTQLADAMRKIADSQFVLAASTVTFNQYAHNKYVFPKPTELRVAWDELQPFLEKLWARRV